MRWKDSPLKYKLASIIILGLLGFFAWAWLFYGDKDYPQAIYYGEDIRENECIGGDRVC